MRRLANAVGKLNQSKMSYGVFVLCATTVIALPAQTFTTLHSFDNTDGASPNAALVQGTDANLYGTTLDGGAAGLETVFKISPSGTLHNSMPVKCGISTSRTSKSGDVRSNTSQKRRGSLSVVT